MPVLIRHDGATRYRCRKAQVPGLPGVWRVRRRKAGRAWLETVLSTRSTSVAWLLQVDPQQVPGHVGVILDGNRRWAKQMGFVTSQGHKRGADKIEEFLGWAEDAGVRVVTLWLLSTDNLSRDPAELSPLLDIIAQAVESLAAAQRWSLRLVGAVDLLPDPLAERLRQAVASTHAAGGEADPGDGRVQVRSPSATAGGRRSPTRSAISCASGPRPGPPWRR